MRWMEPLVIFPRRIAFAARRHLWPVPRGGRSPQVAQDAIQMQTIVNLVSAGLGWPGRPEASGQFQLGLGGVPRGHRPRSKASAVVRNQPGVVGPGLPASGAGRFEVTGRVPLIAPAKQGQ